MTNSEKLRALADWFDGYDFSSKGFLNHNEVQQDLRAMANEFEQLNKPLVMQGCQCKDRIGETKVWCCNQCGLPCEDFWLPTHYTVGSRTVASEGSDKNA